MTMSSRSAAVLAVLVVATSLTACTRVVDGRGSYAGGGDPPQEKLLELTELPPLMLPAEEVGSIVGVPGTTVVTSYETLEKIPDETISDPSCFGAMFGAVEPVYRGSGDEGVFGQRLANITDMLAGRSDQSVIVFGSGPDAQSFVTEQVDMWRRCGEKPLTLDIADLKVNWMIDAPRVSSGVDVLTRLQEGGDGFGCGRGIHAEGNTVIDVVVCGPDPVAAGDHAALIADGILGRYPA